LGHPEQSYQVLIKLGSNDLRAVLEIEVDEKKVYEQIKKILLNS
jgi:hypothetical protein